LRILAISLAIGRVTPFRQSFSPRLLEQLALVEARARCLSRHALRFASAASTVGTPWLALSGGNWHEHFFNRVPVYWVLPDTERYPASPGSSSARHLLPIIDSDSDDEGPRTPSMSAVASAKTSHQRAN
jgi:hypothetical protein